MNALDIKIQQRFHIISPMSYHRSKVLTSPARLSHQKSNYNHPKILYIVRGPPGSGKSTLARSICKRNGIILSTDEYFMGRNGYHFNPSRLSQAHDWNKRRAAQCLSQGRNPVVIDNTNSESWEMKPYMMMALDNGYKIEVVEPNTWWKFDASELEKRNEHNVRKDSIVKMLSRYEKNVTVASVLGSHLFRQYQQQCVGAAETPAPSCGRPQQQHQSRFGSSHSQPIEKQGSNWRWEGEKGASRGQHRPGASRASNRSVSTLRPQAVAFTPKPYQGVPVDDVDFGMQSLTLDDRYPIYGGTQGGRSSETGPGFQSGSGSRSRGSSNRGFHNKRGSGRGGYYRHY